jgi:hypothetical protein
MFLACFMILTCLGHSQFFQCNKRKFTTVFRLRIFHAFYFYFSKIFNSNHPCLHSYTITFTHYSISFSMFFKIWIGPVGNTSPCLSKRCVESVRYLPWKYMTCLLLQSWRGIFARVGNVLLMVWRHTLSAMRDGRWNAAMKIKVLLPPTTCAWVG